jgi:Fe-S-cluster containining protein
VTQEQDLPAGPFGAWLEGMQAALRGERDAEVPCGGCTACCSSSQFVTIAPDETDALAHIPGELLFPAPRVPEGHVVMGYDEHGCCPMLGPLGCTIYEHRPRACRTYDCRVFAATAVDPGEGKEQVAARVRRWRFEHPTDEDRRLHDAVRAAARYVQEHRAELHASNPTHVAVLAVDVQDGFERTEPA